MWLLLWLLFHFTGPRFSTYVTSVVLCKSSLSWLQHSLLYTKSKFMRKRQNAASDTNTRFNLTYSGNNISGGWISKCNQRMSWIKHWKSKLVQRMRPGDEATCEGRGAMKQVQISLPPCTTVHRRDRMGLWRRNRKKALTFPIQKTEPSSGQTASYWEQAKEVDAW